ncbi:MAG TPA: alkene reductase [Gammaproteobacteria bacterium]|nr:alkene reductase [Gammaproteobacteria bacterium]
MNHSTLFQEYRLNHLFTLKNKIIMAPMTRAKASAELVSTPEMADYYARRADAGLIITEGTVISPGALGCFNVPGIFNKTQIQHWQKVTDKVHQKNGLIFLQIWHVGRVSHPAFLRGELPIGPSASTMVGKVYRTENLTYGQSRAVTQEEIKHLIDAYADAARNAISAGFDGVEIHGANGYLIDQFLHYHTNQREDDYGGTPENMTRFALEVVKACGETLGYERVGLRLSPGAYLNQIIGDIKDAQVFQYLLMQLNKYPIAYLHTGNFDDSKTFAELNQMTMSQFLRSHYQGTLIGCGGYTPSTAIDAISNSAFDCVAFGRAFIANPDLVQRIYHQNELRPYDASLLDNLY